MVNMARYEIEGDGGDGGEEHEQDESERDDAVIIPSLRRMGGDTAQHKAKTGMDPSRKGRADSRKVNLCALSLNGSHRLTKRSLRMSQSGRRSKNAANKMAFTVPESHSDLNGKELHVIEKTG